MMLQSVFRFPGFVTRACTLSYDDGMVHDKRLIEIMRKYGMKGTFNLNSRNLISDDERMLKTEDWLSLVGDDTEIALHGYRHLVLEKFPSALGLRDIIANREHLEKTFGKVIRGLAYANGSYDDNVVNMLRMSDVAYARTTVATENFDIPDEWLVLHPTCHHKHPKLFELVDKFLADPVPNTFWTRKPRMFYLWGHSYEFPKDDNWDVIERFCEIMGKNDTVWKATNMEIYNYVKAFYSLKFSADGSYVENLSAIDLYLRYNDKDILVKAGETACTL